MKTVVIAIGGNSLIKDAQHMSGNGPQVGFILLRSEHSRGILHQVPLDSIVADTQGALGYQIQQSLQNEFRRRGLKASVATVVTQTLVDRNDPAFAKPSKPIGQFYTREEAEDRMRVEKWAMVEYVVIAAGGGGIPVVADENGKLSGAAAVIDKDLASAILAGAISADLLVVATSVEKVCLNYGKSNEHPLDFLTAAEATQYMAEGHFQPGSMLPKIQACLQFIEGGGREALITCPQALSAALAGKTGTRIVA